MERYHNDVVISGAICLFLGAFTGWLGVKYMELVCGLLLIVLNRNGIGSKLSRYLAWRSYLRVLGAQRKPAIIYYGRSGSASGVQTILIWLLLGAVTGLVWFIAHLPEEALIQQH
jgi:hypothetical protein